MASALATSSTWLRECKRLLGAQRGRLTRVAASVAALMAVAAVVGRFWAPTPLWLDEVISVNIAKLPLAQIPRALSHDGSPPLYYVALHFWMLLFGHGDFAVRALSGVASVLSLPFFWMAGKRLGGRTTAWASLVLALSSPFAINYATATRMYSLMILWSVLGFLALARVLEAPTRRRRVALGAVTAAVLYTHYWGLYLVVVTGLWLLFKIRREHPDRLDRAGVSGEGYRAAFGSMLLGSLFWLPWSPVFVFQALHTGTPWTGAAGPSDLLTVFGDFGGSGPWGLLLTFGLFALMLLGLFGRRPGDGDVLGASSSVRRPSSTTLVLDLRPQRRALPLFWVTAGTLAVAVLFGTIAQSAFVARYAAVVLPPFLLLAALGVSVFVDRRVVAGLLALLGVAGVLTGFGENGSARTQAVRVAAVLNVQAQPGDVVVFCPDQLGPAVDRLLKVPGVTELTFPRAIGPQRVDWVDYKSVIDHTDVGSFAQAVLSRLGASRTLWLVWRDGYPGLGGDCGYLDSWLNMLRPTGETVVMQNGRTYFEYENLVRYPS